MSKDIKEVRRHRWANINKILSMSTMVVFFSALMSLLWNGEEEAWILGRLMISICIPTVSSIIVYCFSYDWGIE